MNAKSQPSEASPSRYEPPTLQFLGNVHDLLAMAKSADCDAGMGGAPGDDPVDACGP
jgi:hypothetical protein